MNKILKDMGTSALMTAIEENRFAFVPLIHCLPDAQVYDESDLLWSLTNLLHPVFNSVLRARLAPEDVDTAIESAISRCHSRNVPMMWLTGPSTRPTDLGASLERHGFVHHLASPGMAVDLSQLNEDLRMPSNAKIVPVTDYEMLKQWNHTRTVGFEGNDINENAWMQFFTNFGLGTHQPLRYFTALLNDLPVATSMLFLAAGVAGIYGVATNPQARRQGMGAAVTLAALRYARSLGYRVGVLHASQMGKSVYRQLGFQEYCKIGQYIWRDKQEK